MMTSLVVSTLENALGARVASAVQAGVSSAWQASSAFFMRAGEGETRELSVANRMDRAAVRAGKEVRSRIADLVQNTGVPASHPSLRLALGAVGTSSESVPRRLLYSPGEMIDAARAAGQTVSQAVTSAGAVTVAGLLSNHVIGLGAAASSAPGTVLQGLMAAGVSLAVNHNLRQLPGRFTQAYHDLSATRALQDVERPLSELKMARQHEQLSLGATLRAQGIYRQNVTLQQQLNARLESVESELGRRDESPSAPAVERSSPPPADPVGGGTEQMPERSAQTQVNMSAGVGAVLTAARRRAGSVGRILHDVFTPHKIGKNERDFLKADGTAELIRRLETKNASSVEAGSREAAVNRQFASYSSLQRRGGASAEGWINAGEVLAKSLASSHGHDLILKPYADRNAVPANAYVIRALAWHVAHRATQADDQAPFAATAIDGDTVEVSDPEGKLYNFLALSPRAITLMSARHRGGAQRTLGQSGGLKFNDQPGWLPKGARSMHVIPTYEEGRAVKLTLRFNAAHSAAGHASDDRKQRRINSAQDRSIGVDVPTVSHLSTDQLVQEHQSLAVQRARLEHVVAVSAQRVGAVGHAHTAHSLWV